MQVKEEVKEELLEDGGTVHAQVMTHRVVQLWDEVEQRKAKHLATSIEMERANTMLSVSLLGERERSARLAKALALVQTHTATAIEDIDMEDL